MSGRTPRWLPILAVVVAFAAGAYLFSNRSGQFEPLVNTTAPLSGPRPIAPGAGGPPFPSAQRGNVPPGFTMGREMAIVDLNTASLAQVGTLPGITPEYARKIVDGRPYRSMADLERVGIPHAIVEQISPPAIIRTTERGSPPPLAPQKKP
jgi:competence protein ComEA